MSNHVSYSSWVLAATGHAITASIITLEPLPWNNGKEVPRLDLTSSTTSGQQIHKFDHTRTANWHWLLCRWAAALPLVLPCLFTSPSCWGTHFLYLSNPPSGNLLPIIPWPLQILNYCHSKPLNRTQPPCCLLIILFAVCPLHANSLDIINLMNFNVKS